jgi:hypothetical protein
MAGGGISIFLSRTGRISTGFRCVHSSHQCRCALLSRFLIPQLSQTNTSFLTGLGHLALDYLPKTLITPSIFF